MMKHLAWIPLAAMVSVSAQADEAALVDARGYVAFNRIDSDHNGFVSRVEARSVSGVERSFDSADLNSDGLLNSGEYRRARVTAQEER